MLAVRAGGMQWMIAFGAIVESSLDGSITLRAAAHQRLPQNQIQNDAQTVSNHNSNHRPQHPVHAPACSIVIDVDDQQEIAGEYSSDEITKETSERKRGCILLKRDPGMEEDLYANKNQGSRSVGPFGNETQFLGKLGSYFAS
jgi:hypothetical protein